MNIHLRFSQPKPRCGFWKTFRPSSQSTKPALRMPEKTARLAKARRTGNTMPSFLTRASDAVAAAFIGSFHPHLHEHCDHEPRCRQTLRVPRRHLPLPLGGEGRGEGVSLRRVYGEGESIANQSASTPSATTYHSPSPIGWERAGVRVSLHPVHAELVSASSS